MNAIDILNYFHRAVGKKLPTYYRVDNNDLYVYVITKNYSDPLENKIYRAQSNVLGKYPNINIDFRVVPQLNHPIYRIIPEGFKRYSTSYLNA